MTVSVAVLLLIYFRKTSLMQAPNGYPLGVGESRCDTNNTGIVNKLKQQIEFIPGSCKSYILPSPAPGEEIH